ncbi:unnamed protein product [Pocillopora meandrina]|uniref:Centromere protein C n=1 Tax=Pocillopora meandrina TaxID=46732 RepID=A0AAU9XSQ5_9CNID|nr:unnamed protein product [Pocillopora meandrina]
MENANFHPEEDEDVFEKFADDHPLSGLQNSFLVNHGSSMVKCIVTVSGDDAQLKKSSPEEGDSVDRLKQNIGSPNNTGTAIKNPASREPTPRLRGPISKRLSFITGQSPIELKDDQVHAGDSSDDKCAKTSGEEVGDSDTEIDVVNEDPQMVTEEAVNETSYKKKPKSLKKTPAVKKKHSIVADESEDEDIIDVTGTEEDTFLTIGNISRAAKINTAVHKSPLPAQADSFVMSESFVLEGTKHKSMSPEFGSSSDCQDEPATKGYKSRIPVLTKGYPRNKAALKRPVKGKKANVTRDPESVMVSVVGQGDDEEERTGLTVTEKEQARPLQGKRTRGGKTKNVEEPHELKTIKGRGRKNVPNITHQTSRVTRGSKQKNENGNEDDEEVDNQKDDGGFKKAAVRKGKPTKENKGKKKKEQIEIVGKGTEQQDGVDTTQPWGRNIRGQRKRGQDGKVHEQNGKAEALQVTVDDEDDENCERGNMDLVRTGLETEGTGRDEESSVVQRKEMTKKSGTDLTQGFGNTGARKSKGIARVQNLEEREEDDDMSKKKRGKRGKGRRKNEETTAKEDSRVVDIAAELDEAQDDDFEENTNEFEKTNDVSVRRMSNVSSNVSSSSESSKKTSNGVASKRRKVSRVLPPYARKRRAGKANNSKDSSKTSSYDSTELSVDAKKQRLQDEANETSTAKDSPRKDTKTNAGKTSRNKRDTRKSGAKKNSLTTDNFNERADVNDLSQGVEDDNGLLDAPAEPVTALKSILKSGGSVRRSTKGARKRQMTIGKSHSGGSDADDESLQPAKQPNRKSLSSVSFASTPFVRGSPSVPANVSPISLSFASKNSSYKSADGTFTPGSARTVRSSVGSASGSSVGDNSKVDPEEEVTITNDTMQPEVSPNEQHTRRSKRTIVPPLQYWKNERIDYERRKSGGWCIKGIIKNPTPTPKYRKKRKQTVKLSVQKQTNANSLDSSEEEPDNDLEGFQEITNPKGTVLNSDNHEEVSMDIFHTPGMLNFTNPTGKPAQENDPLVVHKYISQPLFGGGQVILRPGAEKGKQFVRQDTMVFYIIKGRVKVTVHKSSAILHTGSTFYVPQGNSYNIENLKKTNAYLQFVQIKG